MSAKRVRPAEGGAGPGLDAAPFQGLRFARQQVGAVTSPPYDVVERRAVPALEALDPHNVIRLTRPRGGAARYAAAAQELAGWRRSGVLARDARPAYYVLTQSGAAGSLVGLLAAVAVPHHPPEPEAGGYASGVLPHEEVMPGPVRDRAALMRRARAQFEPILLQLEPASDGAVAAVLRDPGGDPVVEAWAPDGARQSIHRVEDPTRWPRSAATSPGAGRCWPTATTGGRPTSGWPGRCATPRVRALGTGGSRCWSSRRCSRSPWGRSIAPSRASASTMRSIACAAARGWWTPPGPRWPTTRPGPRRWRRPGGPSR